MANQVVTSAPLIKVPNEIRLSREQWYPAKIYRMPLSRFEESNPEELYPEGGPLIVGFILQIGLPIEVIWIHPARSGERTAKIHNMKAYDWPD